MKLNSNESDWKDWQVYLGCREEASQSAPAFIKRIIHGGTYVNDVLFCSEVLGDCLWFNAICYTANTAMLEKCRRLICAKLFGEREPARKKKQTIRMAKNVHSKIYFVRRRGSLDLEVWTGSMNLVKPGGWHNVMVKAGPEQSDSLKLYFERLWCLCPLR